jgi:hypothetical protein
MPIVEFAFYAELAANIVTVGPVVVAVVVVVYRRLSKRE